MKYKMNVYFQTPNNNNGLDYFLNTRDIITVEESIDGKITNRQLIGHKSLWGVLLSVMAASSNTLVYTNPVEYYLETRLNGVIFLTIST